MTHTHVPKLFIGLTVLFAALLLIGDRNVANGQNTTIVSTAERYLNGFAWSSNIGWISMRGSNYGVRLSPDGSLSGYAWSSNLGWISFNSADVSSCPSGQCAPTINSTTGAVGGWVRACSGTRTKDCRGADRTDGWEGWIHLSGSNHTSPQADGSGGVTFLPSSSRFKGYAWGSDVVGWVNFDGVSVVNDNNPVDPEETIIVDENPPVISVFKMIPNLVNKNQSCTMNWEVDNADSCTIEGEGYSSEYKVVLPKGADKTAPIVSSKIYKLSCSNSAGTVTKTAACRLNPSTTEN